MTPNCYLDLNAAENHTVYARIDRQGNCSIRRLADDVELHRLPGEGRVVIPVLSPDGRFVSVSSGLWQIDGPEPKLLIAGMSGWTGTSYNHDASRAAFAQTDGAIKVHDLTGKLLHALPAHTLNREVVIALHPTEPLIAVGSYFNPILQLRDVRTGQVTASIPVPSGVNGLAWRRDGQKLAVTLTDVLQIRLYDRANWQLYQTLFSRQNPTTVTFNQAGDRLAVYGWSYQTDLFDAETGDLLCSSPAGAA